jgi:hypothetical protein
LRSADRAESFSLLRAMIFFFFFFFFFFFLARPDEQFDLDVGDALAVERSEFDGLLSQIRRIEQRQTLGAKKKKKKKQKKETKEEMRSS